MIVNYFKIAYRNLLSHPGYSSLNILGLAMGIASAFVLFLFVRQETSYEKHFANSENIYRIASDFFNMGGFAVTSEASYRWLKEDCKEAKLVTAVDRISRAMEVEVDGIQYVEGTGLAVDSNFFRMFSFNLSEGSPRHIIQNTNWIVITEPLATKYFGGISAIGKTIFIGKEKTPYTITAVLADNNHKSHLRADLFLPLKLKNEKSWTAASIYVYVMLNDLATHSELVQSFEQLRRDKIYPASSTNANYDTWAEGSQRVEYFIQPLHDIYLHSDFRFDLTSGGNWQQVAILSIIGFFLLFLAIVNYVNLATARSSVRAKEVGIKKTLGASRRRLAGQFLSETMIVGVLSMVGAIGLVELLLPVFEKITGQAIITSIFEDAGCIAWLFLLTAFTSLLAGIYPALYLTQFEPVKILNGKLALTRNKGLRGGLVVFQFAVAVALIIGSVVVFSQLKYIQESDIGFEQEGVLIINNIKDLGDQVHPFRREIESISQVISTSINDRMPAGKSIYMNMVKTAKMEESITLQTFPADEEYVPTLGLRLTEGRNFSKTIALDSSAIILNQTAVKVLGLADTDPIDVILNKKSRIIGVIEDFNYQSLHEKIEPIILSYGPSGHRLALKLKGFQMANFIEKLESTWSKYSHDEPISYSFLDDNFADLASKDRMLGRAVSVFTAMAIIIACLGLLGLAAFMAEQRTKEIGIRKVLGDSVYGIVLLLTQDFIKLVLIALLFAIPLAWYVMNEWLQNFAYRIQISWWILVISAFGAILISLFTIGYHCIRAALAHPVDALRNE